MPRVYKRKLGSREYCRSDSNAVEDALKAVIDKGMSLRAASKNYNVSYGTLNNRYHGLHVKTPGGQPVFSKDELDSITDGLIVCSDWGFPIERHDLPYFIKSLLDGAGRKIKQFKNNMPGEGWVDNYLKKNERISKRWATNISRSRAQVSQETVQAYFDNLGKTCENVPPSNIFNYDETNVVDDPGKKQCIYRRGVKYAEKVCNHSKSALTIMMCGSADGTLLPPYVIYKAENLWDTWTRGGPKGEPSCSCSGCSRGSRYNRSSHGWMDMALFADWFHLSFLPHARKLQGKKVLIGDNLASHFSPAVLKTCKAENISFTCLPPNATNVCQPLDVSFFRPFKLAWRQTLTKAKKLVATTGLQKERFPPLLKETLEVMDQKQEGGAIKRDLIGGFRACGIYPLNPSEVLRRLPNCDESRELNVSDGLLDFLQNQRQGTPRIARKKKKLTVEPGKSVVYSSTGEDSDSSDSSSDLSLSSKSIDLSVSDGDVTSGQSLSLKPDDFVVVNYNGIKFPGQVLSTSNESGTSRVKCMTRSKKAWKWPIKEDISDYEHWEIIELIQPPIQLRRGFFRVPELNE